MHAPDSLSAKVNRLKPRLSALERRVADHILAEREATIMTSAAQLAKAIGTSDATVIRTVRHLGFSSLNDLRQALAADLRADITLADRLSASISRESTDTASTLRQVLDIQRKTLDAMDTPGTVKDFDSFLDEICRPARLLVFGIGPSGHLAAYFATQMQRLGADMIALEKTGIGFADDVLRMRKGDGVIALAYDRPYPEITALFDRATELGVKRLLITSPTTAPPDSRADRMLFVPRGVRDGFGLHAGTLALLEALIVGYAARNRDPALETLERLNHYRLQIAGDTRKFDAPG